ncbi:MAG: hypothetical protein F2667_03220 [Actinobacteria bacterium]|uniref:Unannotated protein n=1 Tax=freshwater metagenome TaxID=449393 RepID=A0A6J6PD51_9ZZZZ|nr:hypothetical protein [Actinomycetota bacterium]
MSRSRSLSVRSALAPTVVLAVLLPVLTVGAALLADGQVDDGRGARSPATADLESTTLVCPTARTDGRILVATDGDQPGAVSVGRVDDSDDLQVAPDEIAETDADGARLVRADGALAPGLVAGRSAGPRLSAYDCPVTSSDQWFTGVGAGATHTSVLELTNPDTGPAVASVTVYSQSGPVSTPRLRGIAVAGGSTVRLDLATVVPRREELALHVTSDRGRVAAAVLDTYDELGRPEPTTEFLPAQADPSSSNVLLGVPTGPGKRTLVLANGGPDVVRVDLELVTEQSVFAPAGVRELAVDPGSVKVLALQKLLSSKPADGAIGLALTSSAPITATLRSFADGDLVQTVAGARVAGETLLALPEGDKRLLVAGARGIGVVSVVGFTADGEEVSRRRVEIGPDRGVSLRLSSRAQLVRVVPERTSVVASVIVTATGRSGGAAVVPLRELVRQGLVPDVRPGLS